MFSSVYQGKYGVEVLSSAGKDPLNKQSKLAKASSSVSREYDRTTKGYVFVMEKASSINCPIGLPPPKANWVIHIA